MQCQLPKKSVGRLVYRNQYNQLDKAHSDGLKYKMQKGLGRLSPTTGQAHETGENNKRKI